MDIVNRMGKPLTFFFHHPEMSVTYDLKMLNDQRNRIIPSLCLRPLNEKNLLSRLKRGSEPTWGGVTGPPLTCTPLKRFLTLTDASCQVNTDLRGRCFPCELASQIWTQAPPLN